MDTDWLIGQLGSRQDFQLNDPKLDNAWDGTTVSLLWNVVWAGSRYQNDWHTVDTRRSTLLTEPATVEQDSVSVEHLGRLVMLSSINQSVFVVPLTPLSCKLQFVELSFKIDRQKKREEWIRMTALLCCLQLSIFRKEANWKTKKKVNCVAPEGLLWGKKGRCSIYIKKKKKHQELTAFAI